ncbi:MAG: YwiC-like family protein [Thermoanaerobaculia bacterium]
MSDACRRSLVPHEHGAYAELGIPLLSALALGRPTAAMYLLAATAVTGFFAYEPLLVLFGYRGARVQKTEGRRAGRRFALLEVLTSVLGVTAVVLAPPSARWALAVPALPMLGVIVLGLTRRLMARVGEIVATVALSSVSVPVAVFGGVPLKTALVLGGVWVAGLVSVNLAVRAVLDHGGRHDRSPARGLSMAVVVAMWAAVAAAASAGWVPWIAPAALAPLSVGSLLILIVFPRPQRIAVLGWTAVAGSLMTAGLLVALLAAGSS